MIELFSTQSFAFKMKPFLTPHTMKSILITTHFTMRISASNKIAIGFYRTALRSISIPKIVGHQLQPEVDKPTLQQAV